MLAGVSPNRYLVRQVIGARGDSVWRAAEQGGARLPASVVPHFARVNSWSTDMRYTPGTMAAHEAPAFVEAAIAIITWADGRL